MKEYHQPDDRWEMFGIKDFESYKKDLVIKGQFHQLVPKDVSESFLLCEYMMAHAYYHYPLYDEALSKLLRIIEMAVKFRCSELKVPLIGTKVNRKTGQQFQKNFSELINEFEIKEPEKKIKEALDRFRTLRNTKMHPERHTYTGMMSKNPIIFGIVIINILFLPVRLFLDMEAEVKRINDIKHKFDFDLFILSMGQKRILVERIEIVGAVQVYSGWQYLIVAEPVLDVEDVKDFTYPVPIITEVTDILFSVNQLRMRVMETGEHIQIEGTNHPDNILKFQRFCQLKKIQKESNDHIFYEMSIKSEIGKRKNEFWYNWLWKVV